MPEFPFLTITKLPPGFLVHLGGMVSSKSVKLLEEVDDRDESDAREAWWVEIRQEVRSHARALGCNMIVGYRENTVIWEDVLILTASGGPFRTWSAAAIARAGVEEALASTSEPKTRATLPSGVGER